MDEKSAFGEYIRRKRLEAGLTQKELAARLYVTESGVSKWERGLSYPDVSLVTDVCRELKISEHEFFTACDDDQAHVQARRAAILRGLGRGFRIFCPFAYAIAVVVCFICDLAIFHALDWFWIVLTAVCLAFCFTNLPSMIYRNRVAVCLGAATICLILLLLACWYYAGGWWLIGGLAITAVSLALPWSWWAVWRFYGRHVPALCMAIFSVWIFALLAVIQFFQGGDWLLRIAFPIAALCVVFLWLFLAAVCWLPAGRWLKGAVCTLLTTLFIPLGNCLSAWMVPEQRAPALKDYFFWGNILARENVNDFSWINVLVFAVMLVISLALLAVGVVKELRLRGKGEE